MKIIYTDTYKGVKVDIREDGACELISPVNGTKRIFPDWEYAENYINNAEAIDSHAEAMARDPW